MDHYSLHEEVSDMENGHVMSKKEISSVNGRTPQNVSSSIMRKKSDPILVSSVRIEIIQTFLANLQEVLLGTKLAVLFPAIPLAIVADFHNFGRVSFFLSFLSIMSSPINVVVKIVVSAPLQPWLFALSLLGLTPLAERVSFLTE